MLQLVSFLWPLRAHPNWYYIMTSYLALKFCLGRQQTLLLIFISRQPYHNNGLNWRALKTTDGSNKAANSHSPHSYIQYIHTSFMLQHLFPPRPHNPQKDIVGKKRNANIPFCGFFENKTPTKPTCWSFFAEERCWVYLEQILPDCAAENTHDVCSRLQQPFQVCERWFILIHSQHGNNVSATKPESKRLSWGGGVYVSCNFTLQR